MRHTMNNILIYGELRDAFISNRKSTSSPKNYRLRSSVATDRNSIGPSSSSMFLLAYLRDLTGNPSFSKFKAAHLRYIVFQDDTPIESMPELLSGLKVRSANRLHLARLVHDSEQSFISRFLAGLEYGEEHGSIMDAWWDHDELVVISPRFVRLRIPAKILPRLRNAPKPDNIPFEIDAEGAYLYWPDLDLHLGWSQLQQITDPQSRLKAEQKSDAFNRRYGQAIRLFRKESGLRQSDFPELDARSIRRIEAGETRVTSNALRALANGHRLTINAYLDQIAHRLGQEKAAK